MANVNLNLDLVTGKSEAVQLLELGNGVVQITMKDEENRNTFSPRIVEGLYKCFGTVAQNKSYKVVILTGYGNYFCSGGTKQELLRIFKKEVKFNDLDFFRLALDCEIPVIAAMQGHGIGGGLVFGLYSDLVVLSQESIYTTNFMKYGFTPGLGCTLIVPEKLGVLGWEMMYTAQNYRGEELAQRGVSFPVVPRKDVLKVAKKIADEMSEKPRLSLITLKKHLRTKIYEKLPEFIEKEVAMHKITFHQPEVASRIEKSFGETTIVSSNPQNSNLGFVREEIRTDSLNCQPFQLKVSSYGLLDNLTFAPMKRQVPGRNEVEVQIKAVPVNFRDALNVYGMLQEYNEKRLGISSAENMTFGFEGVGTVVAVGADVSKWQVGNEVLIIGLHDTFSSFVICSPNKLVAKPKNINVIDAATIPITFFTAYHGLHNLAKLNSGERVLIHAASGGTGQAAVQLAQFFGAEVFATTSPQKMNFLRKQGIKYVINSRTTEFADEIMEITEGRGVDVIFNSLTHGEYIPKNIDILASGGRYVEIGKLNIWTHEQVYQRRSDVKYYPYDLGEEFAKNNQFYSQIWENLGQYFEQNHLHPLPYQKFPIEDVIQAFEYLRHSKHFGRVVVVMPQSYSGQELDTERLSNQDQISNEEKILLQLQSGQVSLENAEQLLLGKTEKEIQEEPIKQKKTDNIQNELINMDSSEEEILSLMSAGEISLEAAEKLLLEVVEPEIKTEEINGFDHGQDDIATTDIATTDIAIIGISCRYPGANNWKELWENLKNGVDSVTEVPPGRWEEKNWYHPDPEHPNTSYSKCAGFLDQVDKFDPLFFQISPEEARFMEPQQRIFLEEAYHAIEDAGYATDALRGKQCGVFVGGSTGDYSNLLAISGLSNHRMVLTGNLLSVIPARIAYFLDLQGPVVAIDTACSSSLVAVHQACESIQQGESEMAIAGGVNILTTAQLQISTSQYQMVSPDGCCKTFDASASGIAWSEGCGVLVLKSYSQAVRDNDHIYGVIKGTGVNYDGNTNGISAPSGKSQASLEEAVYQKFGINPETISYVETQGTSYIGDAIEVEALTEAFSKWTNKKQFCAIGSVKTNIGHSAAASAVSSLIKTILCLKNQKLVPSLHFNQPNPNIDFENSPFYVNKEFKNWEVLEGKPRQAAINTYGISGTNAHVVIEEAPSEVRSQKSEVRSGELERSLHLLTLSAQTEKALSELVVLYQNYLEEENSDRELGDICYTANIGRTHFNHRLAVIAPDKQELVEKLRQHNKNEEVAGVCSGKLPNNITPPKIAFLFTGQGSQYVNMGKELYEKSSVFRKAINKCDEILGRLYVKSLLEILYPEDQDTSNSLLLNQTTYTQPAIFALEYALAQLWQSWGIKPDIVMGHSLGEYVAATVAGIFSLEDALKLITARGQLMEKLDPPGKSVSVMASESKVRPFLTDYTDKVAIAGIYEPERVVIAGESEAVEAIVSQLESEGIQTKQLPQVSHAFHSPLMEPMLSEFEVIANQIDYSIPRIPVISNVTGTKADSSITTAKYWVNHVRQPVQFAQSMNALHQQGIEIFLEVGAKPILLGMGRRCLPEDVGEWLPSLSPNKIPLPSPNKIPLKSPLERGRLEDAALLKDGKPEDAALLSNEWQQMLSSLGKLYVKGAKIDWSEFDSDYARQKVALPTYPFQRERYWIEITDEQQKQYQNSENISEIPIVKLLTEGNTETLTQQLETKVNFSPEQLKLLPEILEVLAQQYQEELGETTETEEEWVSEEFLGKLAVLPEMERHQGMVDYLQVKVGKLLKFPKPELPDPELGFFDMGMDSLTAVKLRNILNYSLGSSITTFTLFGLSNIQDLAKYLINELFLENESGEIENGKNIRYRNINDSRIKPVSRSEDLLLSYAQEWMYFWHEFSPEDGLFDINMNIEIEGPLNVTILEQSFNEIIRRHEVLRTSFPTVDGKPRPVISTVANINLSIDELPPSPEQKTQLFQQILAEAKKAFDLNQCPLLRVALVKLGPESHVLMLNVHHIISDGWSVGILASELCILYEAYSQGKPSPLPELPIQYVDYAHWEQQKFTGKVLEENLSYWRQKLAGTSSVLPLITNPQRQQVENFEADGERFELDQILTEKLTQLGQKSGTTLFTILLSAVFALLYRYSRESDLIVGAVTSNRKRVEIEPLIGVFVNILPIRSQFSDNSSFTELLTQVKQTTQEADKHQDFSVVKLIEELLPERNLGESPLTRVYFNFVNLKSMNSWDLPGLRVTRKGLDYFMPEDFILDPGDSLPMRMDLEIYLWEAQSGSGLEGYFLYKKDLLDKATITGMIENFLTLLEAIVANPQEKISKLPLITAAEKQKILQEWNNTKKDYPADKCIHQLFEEVVEKSSDSVALIFEDQQLTYAQLNQKANQLAHYLLGLGISLETPIGIYIDPTPEKIIGLLAILKAGGAYVAIDPTSKSQDLTSISVILTLDYLKSELPDSSAQILCLDTEWESIATQNTDNPNTATTPTNLAYILNQTPVQAGCSPVEHQAVVQRLQWLQETLEIIDRDILLHKTSLNQDVALLEIGLPLISGGSVVIAANDEPTELQKLIGKHKVTVVHLYPSELPTWLNTTNQAASLNSWRSLLCSGETLSTEIGNKFIETYPVSLHNFYSIPEAAGEITHWQWLEEPPGENVPVGNPGRLSVYVLDQHQNPVPTGVPGEIYIGGSSLARGYLHQQQQTSQKFIEHPQLGKLFQTGDIGRYHNQGYLEIVGTKQRHTWFQGKRIELADIETAILSVPEVEQAYVLANQTFLIAYVVVAGAWNPQQLHSQIQQQLPPYMIPGAYVPVSSLPLTHEGKVDEVALAHFPVTDNETERKIAQKRSRGSHVYVSPI